MMPLIKKVDCLCHKENFTTIYTNIKVQVILSVIYLHKSVKVFVFMEIKSTHLGTAIHILCLCVCACCEIFKMHNIIHIVGTQCDVVYI